MTPRAAEGRGRYILLGVTGVAFVGVGVLAPNYVRLQLAADADRFREVLTEVSEGRAVAATLLDFVFAGLYAACAIVFGSGRRRFVVGKWVLLVAAVFDELENSQVFSGVRDPDGLTDATVDRMAFFGDVKLPAFIVGLALLVRWELLRRGFNWMTARFRGNHAA